MKLRYNLLPLFVVLLTSMYVQSQPIRLKRMIIEEYDTTVFKTKVEHKFYYSGNNRQGVPPGIDWIERLIIGGNAYVDSMFVLHDELLYDSMSTHIYGKYNSFQDNDLVRQQSFDLNDNPISERRLFWAKGLSKWQTQDSNIYIHSGGALLKRINLFANDSTIYHYESGGHLDTIITYVSNNVYSKYTWRYDVSGNVIESTDNYSHIYYTYNSSNKLDVVYCLNINNVDTERVKYYKYDTNSDLVEYVQRLGSSILSLTNNDKAIYTYDANHKRIHKLQLYRNAVNPNVWDNMHEWYYTYNSYGLLERITQKTWDEQNAIFSYGVVQNGKYYGAPRVTFDYGLPLNITSQPTGKKTTLYVYPNPTHDKLTIETSFKLLQPFTVTMTDMQGRVLRTWNEPPAKDYQCTISIADMPAGNYILKLDGKKEQLAQQFVVY